MPLYDYRCTECSEVTEVVAFMHSKPDTVQCESCSAVAKFCFLPPKKKLKKKQRKRDKKIKQQMAQHGLLPAEEIIGGDEN